MSSSRVTMAGWTSDVDSIPSRSPLDDDSEETEQPSQKMNDDLVVDMAGWGSDVDRASTRSPLDDDSEEIEKRPQEMNDDLDVSLGGWASDVERASTRSTLDDDSKEAEPQPQQMKKDVDVTLDTWASDVDRTPTRSTVDDDSHETEQQAQQTKDELVVAMNRWASDVNKAPTRSTFDDDSEQSEQQPPKTKDDLVGEEEPSCGIKKRCCKPIMIVLCMMVVLAIGASLRFALPDDVEDSDPPSSPPSESPSSTPSAHPSEDPSHFPSQYPSAEPSQVPTTQFPSETPSLRPSRRPTGGPTGGPTSAPTSGPTESPSDKPSINPTGRPSVEPSMIPSLEPSINPTESPSVEPSMNPTTSAPSAVPSFSPSFAPSLSPTAMPTEYSYTTVVLGASQRLEQGEYVSSPSGQFRVGFSSNGDFELIDTVSDSVIWHAGITGGYRLYMQSDGNCIIRDKSRKSLWSTETSKNDNSQLVLDDGGMVGVLHDDSYVWIQGVPRGTYDGPNEDITLPIRGTFYYNWYPETWEVSSGHLSRFEPDNLGYYDSGDPKAIEAHLDQMAYGNIELGIVSWWGQSKNNDRARISVLQNMTVDLGYDIKWCAYYEEMGKTKTVEDVREDLAYLKKWFAWHPTWAHVDGKPVVFVYMNKGCDNLERWMEASDGEWHVVPKIFYDYEDCSVQPNSWHQYAPARDVLTREGKYFVISPGFWHAGRSKPDLPRLSKSEFCNNVQDMVDSEAPWQLITTFNEAGEGTIIEPSEEWESDSGYGYYLDCLHDIV
eukprot:scaffold6638_cov127-Cylindrotheca_fusiformis.AAC.13